MRNTMEMWSVVLLLAMASVYQQSSAQQCGVDVNGTLCSGGLCCSQYGYCGSTTDYCGAGCQSQCTLPPPPPPSPPPSPPVTSTSGLGCVVNSSLFDQLFPNRNSFYTYNAFITAGNAFPRFGTEGNLKTKLREIAAFAAHVQQETAGLVYIREIDQSFNYCDDTDTQYPCAPNQSYYGRGPLQLSWNYNYGPASSRVGADILAKPDLVATDPVISFKSSLWFWTQSSSSIPSIHNVLIGKWKPSPADLKAGRKPGFGVTIDIINGNDECGKVTVEANNRVKYFLQFTSFLGVDPGKNLNCSTMQPYN